MNEDYSTRIWADHHAAISDSIHAGLRAVFESLKVLNDLQFRAPWHQLSPEKDCTAR